MSIRVPLTCLTETLVADFEERLLYLEGLPDTLKTNLEIVFILDGLQWVKDTSDREEVDEKLKFLHEQVFLYHE
jgi:hypothetical protein